MVCNKVYVPEVVMSQYLVDTDFGLLGLCVLQRLGMINAHMRVRLEVLQYVIRFNRQSRCKLRMNVQRSLQGGEWNKMLSLVKFKWVEVLCAVWVAGSRC